MELHWSRKAKTEEDLACWHSLDFQQVPSHWEAAWQGLWVGTCEVWGQQCPSVPQRRAEPSHSHLSVHTELCLYPHFGPFPDCSSGTPGALQNPKPPGELSCDHGPPGEAEMTEQPRGLWKWNPTQTCWFWRSSWMEFLGNLLLYKSKANPRLNLLNLPVSLAHPQLSAIPQHRQYFLRLSRFFTSFNRFVARATMLPLPWEGHPCFVIPWWPRFLTAGVRAGGTALWMGWCWAFVLGFHCSAAPLQH